MIATGTMLIRLGTAAVLGSIIGWERERRAWTAGLRTHMMVCLGSALIMLVSMFGFRDVVGTSGIMLDPSRVAAQVVSGIGFLGAGTIVFLRNEIIKGLTTAAGLWTVAAIGLAVGGGLYVEAVSATFIAFLILLAFKPLEELFFAKNKFKRIRLVLNSNKGKFEEIEAVLAAHDVKFSEIDLNSTSEEGIDEIKIKIQKDFSKKKNLLSVIAELKMIKGVREVNFLS